MFASTGVGLAQTLAGAYYLRMRRREPYVPAETEPAFSP
jgi:hypothetical protein